MPLRLSWIATPAASLLMLFSWACSKAPAPQPEAKQQVLSPTPSVPQVRVSPAVQAKAETPKPGPKATHQQVADKFGKGKASITVKGHPGGVDHSFWTEELDIDGSGNPVEVDEAWDNRHKVLYLSNDRSFQCSNGQTADGSVLMAIYGNRNALSKPAGSGWWVAELDQGECSVQTAGIYGCRFDANGTNQDCGSATVQADADDVVIVPLPGPPSAAASDPSSTPVQPSAPQAAPATPPGASK